MPDWREALPDHIRKSDRRAEYASKARRDLHGEDPRELRLQIMADYAPDLTGGFAYADNPAAQATAYLGGEAMHYLDAPTRVRDAAIKSLQAASSGDYGKAAWLAATLPAYLGQRTGVSPGSYGAPDDWRADADRLGVSPGNVAAIDLFTDPTLYFGLPGGKAAVRAVSRAPSSLARAARAGIEGVRYGFTGIPTELLDASGEVIRRLPNSGRLPSRPPLAGLLEN